MFEQILNQLREKVRARQYVMTIHADDEMDEDGLTIFDVESAILSGKIIERQKDQSTGEWKYLVRGESLAGESSHYRYQNQPDWKTGICHCVP